MDRHCCCLGPRCVLAAQLWGLGLWVFLFLYCIRALAPRAADVGGLSPGQWAAYVAIALAIWLCEGLGAFQRSFSPLLVRRARELAPSSSCLDLLLSPGFVAGLFAARPARLVKSWLLIAVLVPGLALTVPHLRRPWRESVDAGVVLGLGWGTAAILVHALRALLTGRWPEMDPDLPVTRAPSPDAASLNPASRL